MLKRLMRDEIYEFQSVAAGRQLESHGLVTVARNGCHVNRAGFLILNQVFMYCALSKFTLATNRSKSAAASDVYTSRC